MGRESVEDACAGFIDAALRPIQDTDKHLLTLFSLALSCQGKVLVELGVKAGTSSLPLLWGAHLNGGKLISVDKSDPTWAPPSNIAASWEFRKQDALEFLKSFDQRIDLVFIDDWHAYPHVKRELELLDRLVGPGSLILMHDVMHGHTEPFYNVDLSQNAGQWEGGGPARAMMELDPLLWEWASLPWWHGLAIIRKKWSKLYHWR